MKWADASVSFMVLARCEGQQQLLWIVTGTLATAALKCGAAAVLLRGMVYAD